MEASTRPVPPLQAASVLSLPDQALDIICGESFMDLADVARLRMTHPGLRDAGDDRVQRELCRRMVERLQAFKKRATRVQCTGYAAYAEHRAEVQGFPSKRAAERHVADAAKRAASDESLKVIACTERVEGITLSLQADFVVGWVQANLLIADERVSITSLFLFYGCMFAATFDDAVLKWKPTLPPNVFTVGRAVAERPRVHLDAIFDALQAFMATVV